MKANDLIVNIQEARQHIKRLKQ